MTPVASRILILDGEQRSALAATRSLGRAGMRVIVGSEQKTSLSGCSRFCDRAERYESPFVDSHRFVRDVLDLIARYEIDVVIPMTDISTYYILKHEQVFRSAAILPLPSFEQYLRASDKIKMVETAKSLGIPVPDSIIVSNPEVCRNRTPDFEYPRVLKPQASLIDTGDTIAKCGVRIVHSRDELCDVLDRVQAFRYPFMIQEHLGGEGLGIFALFDRGRPVTVFAHRRLREKPPWGGVSVLSESVEPDLKAQAYALSLLEHLKWHGVAMVEFKRDHRTHEPKLMEINARFWGTLQLAIYAGVDFPMQLLRIARGEPVPNQVGYSHVEMRWLLGDIDSLYLYFKEKIINNRCFGSNLDAVFKSFVASFRPSVKYQVFWPDDIFPFLIELKQYLKMLL